MSNLSGLTTRRCILVTGATSGIGRALAIALSGGSSQRRVVAAGRRLSRLEELKTTYEMDIVELDLAKEKEALKLDVEAIVKAYPDVRPQAVLIAKVTLIWGVGSSTLSFCALGFSLRFIWISRRISMLMVRFIGENFHVDF